MSINNLIFAKNKPEAECRPHRIPGTGNQIPDEAYLRVEPSRV